MTCIIRIFLQLALASLTLLITTTVTAAPPHIVCTIKPACLLVKAIVGEQENTTQLLPDNADLHHYNFRPSDLRKLSQANVVVRISPTLEQFITPLLNPTQQTIITLADSPKLTFLPMPEKHQHNHSQTHTSHNEEHNEHHEHHEHEAHKIHPPHKEEHEQPPPSSIDPHFWLDPDNAIKMAHYLTVELIKIDPKHAKRYQSNRHLLIDAIKETDQYIHQLLLNDQHKPYLTFHPSFQYFEKHYHLAEPEIISLHEGLPPGIKSLRHLRQFIQKTGIQCLVTQPSANQALTQLLTEGFSMTVITLNPVGSTHQKTHNNYIDLLRYSAQQLHFCLKK